MDAPSPPPMSTLVALPVDQVVRVLARGHLLAMDEAAEAWMREGEMGALHRLRVELRRMRTLLRVYRPWTGRVLRRRPVRGHLRGLGAVTGPVRDLDVQLRDLQGGGGKRSREREAHEWLRGRLDEERGPAVKALLKWLVKDYPRLRKELDRAFSGYRMKLDPASPWTAATPFGQAASRVVTELALELHEAVLLLARGPVSPETMHATRILAKRLRYTLTPLAGGFPEVEPLLARLEGVQDHLGGLQDARVQAERLRVLLEGVPEEEGTAGIRSTLRTMEGRARKRVQGRAILPREWRGAGTARFLTEARTLAGRLAEGSHPTGEGGEPSPAVAPEGSPAVEIERKYLLTGLPPFGRSTRRVLIHQGWIPGEQLQERLRSVREDGTTRYFRTVKLGRGVRRVEVEEETTPEIFRRLWRLTTGRRVRKRRFIVQEEGHTWEVDQFLDRELVLAEVELPSEETSVVLPPWLAPLVVREVTGEDAFVNVNLAG
jgi:CHAD domain-containing protein/CYTH domain-containing protein